MESNNDPERGDFVFADLAVIHHHPDRMDQKVACECIGFTSSINIFIN